MLLDRRRPTARSRTLVTAALTGMVGALVAVTAPVPASADTLVHGLKGDYYRSSGPGVGDFAELRTTQIDPSLEFPNLEGVLQAATGQDDRDSVRWTGRVDVPATDAYTFSIIGDNGFRLWVDGTLVIDHWVDDWDNRQTSAPVQLTAGLHDIRVDYFEDFGGSNLHVSWSTPTSPLAPIPATAYYLPADYTPPVSGDATVATNGSAVTLAVDHPFVQPLPTGLTDHLHVMVDDVAYPVTSIAVDPAAAGNLVITLGAQVQKGATVRVTYDGNGGLATSEKSLPAFSLPGINSSTYTLDTPWAKDVSPTNALPDYPRPQLARVKWENLNGTWQFEEATEGQAAPLGQQLDGSILVPYPVESKLSGVQKHVDRMFYRRTFTVPADWKIGSGQRLVLNFGAVDYQATVWVNGTQVTSHTGGYDKFSADITDAVTGTGPQEIVVGVVDTTDSSNQPVGKQTNNPGGIFYTPASGIWQTVWLEPVAAAHIDSLGITSDVPGSAFVVTPRTTGASADATVTVVASAKGKEVARVTGPASSALRVPIADAHLWSPSDPYLYDLSVTLHDGDSTDAVTSYQGLRSIGLKVIDGKQRIVLNGKPTFLLSTLDQGYWPDGIYTAPTDEALAFDLVQHKEMGFNTVRKHIKVEPDRWYYWADRLGLLVWQDMPATFDLSTGAKRASFESQLDQIVTEHDSDTSVIGWIPFNEGWGEYSKQFTGEVADHVKALDPTRLVDAHSGVNCCNSHGDSGHGDVIDWHQYNGPAFPAPDANRAAVDGEHGGFGLVIPGHTWPGGSLSNYGADLKTTADLTRAYVANQTPLIAAASCGLSGSVYTQITDVETELNGLWTYDRRVEKVDPAAVRDINQRIIAAGESTGQVQLPPGKPGLVGVGDWQLDEGSGTVTEDTSGGAHDGTLVGGPTWTAGKTGSALHFDGHSQYVDTGAEILDTSGNYTVSAWAKLDSTNGFATVVSQDGASRSDFFLQYSGADHRWAFSTPDVRALASDVGEPKVGQWYHLTGVRDVRAGQLRIYVDGALAGTASTCGGVDDGGNLVIGRAKWDGNPVDFFPGTIDSVHAYDRVLSDAEIASLAAQEPTTTTPSDVTAAVDELKRSGDLLSSEAGVLRPLSTGAESARAAHDYATMRTRLQALRTEVDTARTSKLGDAARDRLSGLLDAQLPARTGVQGLQRLVGDLSRQDAVFQSGSAGLLDQLAAARAAEVAGDPATVKARLQEFRAAVATSRKVSASARATLLARTDAVLATL
ncbi:glycosyl hydrolase family 2 [Motilibacter rhizosphaerae]|uniref:Glycosyl hydrolase family 2 n=1 Tax=Motilibacter rhizosphaerae TaxID=598652 RepID=A0A4Q7NS86_9ACTN|nr:LamG-like jellyroll fold domain-containing protein [Motilibacter rhizosphaerae]RZS89957.1 glycosyl hydrolase family 2 [Motilibacter rhizosphaerae]